MSTGAAVASGMQFGLRHVPPAHPPELVAPLVLALPEVLPDPLPELLLVLPLPELPLPPVLLPEVLRALLPEPLLLRPEDVLPLPLLLVIPLPAPDVPPPLPPVVPFEPQPVAAHTPAAQAASNSQIGKFMFAFSRGLILTHDCGDARRIVIIFARVVVKQSDPQEAEA